MDIDSYTIVLTGLGGQGLIKLLQILGNALMIEGYKVITSETHGLSQRGGKVTCFLRFGKEQHAPIPIIGTTDMIIALELSCILDVLKYVKPDKSTNLIISTYEKHEFDTEYPPLEYTLESLYENSENIHFIPANEIAVKSTGNLKAMNIVILGYILRFLPIKIEAVENALNEYFSGKKLEINLKTLMEGQNL
ncbi:MAG: 2-oxoacid:acceptor oxidoreductase family protein [Candidatus Lokiarchaeota archaeon]|nr:2-oxoacid:acceptor oxidoreductase family protein [Candidatus Lokiarchaeota archaeon]